MKLAAWAVLMSIVTIAYVLKAVRFAFLGELKEKFANITEVPAFMRVSLIVLALVCLLGGLLLIPDLRNGFLGQAVEVLTRVRGV